MYPNSEFQKTFIPNSEKLFCLPKIFFVYRISFYNNFNRFSGNKKDFRIKKRYSVNKIVFPQKNSFSDKINNRFIGNVS